ncbi:MAG: 4-alpha-glucanotransferase [Actinomycetota bacterium]
MTTDAWGIDDGWVGTSGAWHPASDSTLAAIGDAVGRTPGDPPGRPVWVVRPGARERLQTPCHLVLEDGTAVGEIDDLDPDVPLGIHDLTPLDGGPTTTLIVSPGRCHLPEALRAWGVAMQIPTTRSRAGWGIGDLGDVRAIARWLDELGGGALALSPVHAPTPIAPIQTSPYYPSSRRWRSPLLLRIEEVPDAASTPEVALLAEQARRASRPIVDRDVAWRYKRQALEVLWASRSQMQVDRLERWRSQQGEGLEAWSLFCALAERHGPGWSSWPSELRDPASAAVRAASPDLADRVAFHAWLQQLADEQLGRAGSGDVRLIQDLAVGVDPDGADAWLLQQLLAPQVRVGAPPDGFAPAGQDWGFPPFVPWRLRDAGYRPLADLLRASMSSGGVRIDHVMGLARLFWIPAGMSPAEGTYVRFAGHELLEVLALESARASALVVGEDLGTVEHGLREELRARGVLSTRLVWFEDDPPEHYPNEALAMVTTHDLPTIAGAWTGADEAELVSLGRPTPEAERRSLRSRLAQIAALPDGAPAGAVVDAVHRRLGCSSAALALATLEDLCEVAERPNIPGTMADQRPNWSRSLPLELEDLTTDPTVTAHLRSLAEGRGD